MKNIERRLSFLNNSRQVDLAQEYGVSQSTIGRIQRAMPIMPLDGPRELIANQPGRDERRVGSNPTPSVSSTWTCRHAGCELTAYTDRGKYAYLCGFHKWIAAGARLTA